MEIFTYGNPSATTVLVQPIGDQDLDSMAREVEEIEKRVGKNFCLMALKVESWNRELSPWKAPAVFGRYDFGGEAAALLKKTSACCREDGKRYYLGGYSLAGLFSLWAAYQTEHFRGVAAVSPSVWFPGFLPYMREHAIQVPAVYLSLGDQEEKTKNTVMASVGDCIREGAAWLREQGVQTVLEWNAGNHFREPEVRTAKGFAWLMKEGDGKGEAER